MNNIDHLIQMANQIGAFFNALPNREEGVEGVANHIRQFWDPRMRRALLNYLEQHPDGKTPNNALSEIALSALTRNRERLMPQIPQQ